MKRWYVMGGLLVLALGLAAWFLFAGKAQPTAKSEPDRLPTDRDFSNIHEFILSPYFTDLSGGFTILSPSECTVQSYLLGGEKAFLAARNMNTKEIFAADQDTIEQQLRRNLSYEGSLVSVAMTVPPEEGAFYFVGYRSEQDSTMIYVHFSTRNCKPRVDKVLYWDIFKSSVVPVDIPIELSKISS